MHGSLTSTEYRRGRTILIAALIVIGVCLFAVIAGLSLCVPLALEDESSLVGGLYRLP